MFITTTGEAPGTNRFEISGTKGKLVCEDGKLFFHKNANDSIDMIKNSPEAFPKAKPEIIEVETDGENPQHAGIINNFTAALLGKEELFVEGTDGLAGVELMNAIEFSGWMNGARVTLPVDEDEYLAELDKKRATSRAKAEGNDKVADTAGTF